MADPKQANQKSVKIAAGAVVCVESEIRGDVTIGPRTVIHPKARIIADAGPIIIGEGNLIEEQALIINSYPENIMPDTEGYEPKTMTIGTNNVFEPQTLQLDFLMKILPNYHHLKKTQKVNQTPART
ncbi:hypothetical protein PDJAM_G00171690 [Pangasius djambal]|uniref:Uncharacterized protein n=1 Tax=Pangasius djambal TaxID=1691987 RepID=A0ACC5ZP51_9TELE|nr:hypothetical protein [Pangasius djambal]